MKTMLSRALAAAFALSAVAAPQIAQATDGPIQMPGTNRWYQVVKERSTWEQARAAATGASFQGMAGHLANVANSAENDFLHGLTTGSVYWLGGRDIGPRDGYARNWVWVDGPESGTVFVRCTTAVGAESCTTQAGQFSAWDSPHSQPDGVFEGKSETALDIAAVAPRADGWHDNPCVSDCTVDGYIVEFEPIEAVPPVKMPGTNRWYQLQPSILNWADATSSAERMRFAGMRGRLVTIESAAENDFIADLSQGVHVWIGAKQSRSGTSREFAWASSNGSESTFTRCSARFGNDSCTTNGFANWHPGEPNNHGGDYFSAADDENCVIANWGSRGLWNDMVCHQLEYAGVTYGVYPSVVEFAPTVPSAPSDIAAERGGESVTVRWSQPAEDGGASVNQYTVIASPGGHTCSTTLLSCTVTGLTNRQVYTFTVTATNSVGTSQTSDSSAAVMPLAPGFQAWPIDDVLAVGGSTELKLAQAVPGASVAITGSTKATMTADSAGFGSATFTATKAGIQKFTASYSVKVGKKTTKYTATAQVYVPSVSGPMLKIKQGKTGKFSLQFMPSGTAVSIALSDGRTLTGTADSAGKATFTPTFSTLGAVMYTASVAGVQIGTGGLTITK